MNRLSRSRRGRPAKIVTLARLWRDLHQGHIYECALRHPVWHLDGLQETNAIYIDPRSALLETLVHELLHRLHGEWSEDRVDREARRLALGMSERMKTKWWRAYQSIKRTHRALDVE